MTNITYMSIPAFYPHVPDSGALTSLERQGFSFRLRVSFEEFMLIMEELRPVMDGAADLAFTYIPQGDTEWAALTAEMLPGAAHITEVADALARAWFRINDRT